MKRQTSRSGRGPGGSSGSGSASSRSRPGGPNGWRGAGRPSAGGTVRRLRIALWAGAAVWLALLIVGFFAPGGWTWGMAGPIGHMENYMISLWLVGLVCAPLLAARQPVTRTAAIQLYLLAVLAVCLSTFRGEQLKWIADGPPLAVAAACIAGVLLTHPDRSTLLRI